MSFRVAKISGQLDSVQLIKKKNIELKRFLQ